MKTKTRVSQAKRGLCLSGAALINKRAAVVAVIPGLVSHIDCLAWKLRFHLDRCGFRDYWLEPTTGSILR